MPITNNIYPVKLPAFEGPLDLLLFLIRKNEVDIYDIPIETVTRQYLKTLYEMEQMQLEVAGEFFVMAATLMEIKSRMLLPKHVQAAENEDEEEEFDPRWELVHQLLEYQKFKKAAHDMNELAAAKADLFERYIPPARPLDATEQPLKKADKLDLWHAFNQVLRRLSEKLVVGEIHDDPVTVADRMEYLLDQVRTGETIRFSALFAGPETINIKVVISTFMGILELVRLRQIKVWQDESFTEIFFCGDEGDAEPENPPGENRLENDVD